jgi:NAD(P)-dependent dehydrogenase (short-subunit alcohol dehydrogenase family)
MKQGVALVTGASRGIGAAAAVALAEKGYDVALAARTLQEGERHEHSAFAGTSDTRPLSGSLEVTASEVRKRGREALPIRMDLLQRASLDSAIDEAEDRLGPIELLVNNGIYQGPGSHDLFRDLEVANFEKVLQGNLIAPILLIQRVLPGMLARGSGMIMNVVSASATMDPPAPIGKGGWGFGYVAAKAALIRLAGILAVEYPDAGVAFFNVEPGFVFNEIARRSGLEERFVEQWGGAPPEVPAAVMAWLATDPGAAEWHGKMIDAQRLCKKLGLVPGWPKPRGAAPARAQPR